MTKEKKLTLIDEMVARLGISREDILKHWQLSSTVDASLTTSSEIDILGISNFASIEPGMFWYEDDTFSFKKLDGKRIKAIVELVENTVIYGDLTASEIYRFSEVEKDWFDSIKYINNFPYKCNYNERVVMYDVDQLKSIRANYKAVQESFQLIGKPCRKDDYWTTEEFNAWCAMIVLFHDDVNDDNDYFWGIARQKNRKFTHLRPVIALQVG